MLTAIGILLGTGVLCLLAPRRSSAAPWICAFGCVIASGFAIAAATSVLAGGPPAQVSAPLEVPGGAFTLALDPLSAFFLLLISLLAPLAAVFGAGYLAAHGGRGTRSASFFFCLLVASMMLVAGARNGLLFMVAWETMTLTSWALVVSDHDLADVRAAGRTYLIASQLAGACLAGMFAILGVPGGLDFAAIAASAPGLAFVPTWVVLGLAFVGFGTKAGLFPLHVWLPLAHPAAPSHVSAVMSGIMIKMGIYGLLRVQLLLGGTPVAFSVGLVVIGALTAVFGIASALGQRDLKRALACSSIENMGIAAVGLGLASLAARLGHPDVAALAAAGVVLHLLAHMTMKGLLFLGAGTVASGAHTRDVEKLGGLLRRMPWTGAAFASGAAGLSALPPFAGLAGEWLLLLACFRGAMTFPVEPAVLVVLAGLALAASGGLAAASFTRLFGIVFLGAPRSTHATEAAEGRASMVVPLLVLAAASLALGLWPETVAAHLSPVIAQVAGSPDAAPAIAGALAPLGRIALVAALLLGVVAAVLLIRSALPGLWRGRRAQTWGCGYSRPSARAEYTGSSYTRPLVGMFAALVKPRAEETRADGLFPQSVRSSLTVPDRVEKGFYEPLFAFVARRLAIVRKFQHGELNKYVLQIVGALVVGLLWAVAFRWVGSQ